MSRIMCVVLYLFLLGIIAGCAQTSGRNAVELAGMVYVEGGTFTMGGAGGESDELPAHQVTVSSFYIGKYEVTQAEWVAVMDNNRSHFKGDNLPVENVSWRNAIEYCNKRSVKEGLQPVYSGSGNNIAVDWSANGYRLPTEAEWEYAAKGGHKPSATKYSGSDNADTVAWYGNPDGSTHPVGTKAANSLGIHDMSGNVWEWCWDQYGAYTSAAQTNPVGAASGVGRVIRGGSWNDAAQIVRLAYRDGSFSSERYYGLGFRVVHR